MTQRYWSRLLLAVTTASAFGAFFGCSGSTEAPPDTSGSALDVPLLPTELTPHAPQVQTAPRTPSAAKAVDRSLSEAITAARYAVAARGFGFEATNARQRFRASFSPDGLAVQSSPRPGSSANWRLGMRLADLGYGARRTIPVAAPTVRGSDARVDLVHPIGRGESISEWYVNRPNGIEQGFTLAKPPGTARNGEPLSVRIELNGDLTARASADARSVELTGGGAKLRYDGLHVYDSTGRELVAQLGTWDRGIEIRVSDQGASYPLSIDPTLTQEAHLFASDAAGADQFGGEVAVDGNTAVVGAVGHDNSGGSNAGAVYVFVRSGTSWSQQAKLEASDAGANDSFGFCVDINGETIVVGSPNDDTAAGANAGSAYIFVRSGTSWSEQAKLTTSDAAAGDGLGVRVAIDGDTVIAGALNADTTAGANAGAAYVFVRSGTSWSQQGKLEASDAAAGDIFGSGVALEGNRAVIGAPSADPSSVTNAGRVYVFARSGTSWSQEASLVASSPATSDQLGDRTAVSGDTIVSGAFFDDTGAGTNAGSVTVWRKVAGSWTTEATLVASDGAANDLFGRAVALEGNTLVVGAINDDNAGGTDAGSAYIFTRSGSSWTEAQKLLADDGAASDLFGLGVALSGDTVVAGSVLDNTAGGTDAGSAYVFTVPNQNPVCTGATPSEDKLWPPNHQFEEITIEGVTDPDSDPVTIEITGIEQDEPVDDTGDGHTCPDGQGVGTDTAELRQERKATLLSGGNGRVYTISFTADDGQGGTCNGSVTVCAPRTASGSCTHSGTDYDSTDCGVVSFSGESYCPLEELLHLLGDPLCLDP